MGDKIFFPVPFKILSLYTKYVEKFYIFLSNFLYRFGALFDILYLDFFNVIQTIVEGR